MRKGFKGIVPKTVDEYLELQEPEIRSALEKLRKTIRSAAPQAEEIISYQIPSYKYNGALVHFAAFKDHCSFFVVNKQLLKDFEKELQPYKTSGTTIHFTPENPLPATVVKEIVKKRIIQNKSRL